MTRTRRLQLAKWLKDNADDKNSSLNDVPMYAVTQFERLLHSVLSSSMTIKLPGQSSKKKLADDFTSFAAKSLRPEDSDFNLELSSTSSRLELKVDAGRGIARLLVAQFLAAQNRMFKNMNFNFQPAKNNIRIDSQ